MGKSRLTVLTGKEYEEPRLGDDIRGYSIKKLYDRECARPGWEQLQEEINERAAQWNSFHH